jgi:hypothetical protein
MANCKITQQHSLPVVIRRETKFDAGVVGEDLARRRLVEDTIAVAPEQGGGVRSKCEVVWNCAAASRSHSSPAGEDEPGGELMNARIDSGKQFVERSLTTLGRAGRTSLDSLGRAGRTSLHSLGRAGHSALSGMDRAGRRHGAALALVGGLGTLVGPLLGGLLVRRRAERVARKIALRSAALGAVAGGALALGVVSIGVLVVARMSVRSMRVAKLHIGELEVAQSTGTWLPATTPGTEA